MKKVVVVLGVVAGLAACVPQEPPSATLERFEPNPSGGAIYILRGRDPVFLGVAPVKLDGQPVASLRRDDYVRLDVAPGQHRITCGEADASAQAIDIVPGQTVFFDTLLRVGWVSAPECTLMPLDEPSGRQRVSTGKRVGAGP